MSYEVLEKQIKALPKNYYEELIDYVNYLSQKATKQNDISEEQSMEKMRETSLKTTWEYLKNDTW